ncbi:MAG: hypothetical protein K8S20_16215 [Chloroflexi bacterium]|nr:hypothetical protein [Chloroflexota bacterium]
MGNEKQHLGRRDFFKLTGGVAGIAALSYFLGLRDRPSPASRDHVPEVYVDNDQGFPVFRGPYLQKNVKLAAFLFRADVTALTGLCDRTLNTVDACPYVYVPMTSTVLLVYADMLVSSLDERDARIGSIPETEIGFWVLTVAMKKTQNGHTPHHLAWFLPHLLVDESNSMVTGREVYGFNKQAGQFQKPGDLKSPRFAADVLGFRKFDPASVAQPERLLELGAAAAESTRSQWMDWGAARTQLLAEMIANVRADFSGGMLEFAARAITNHIPLVFLKQFRDSANSKNACYKAVIEAPLKISKYSDGGPFSQSYQLKLNSLESHPYLENLGLKGEQTSKLAAWLNVDFILDHGVEM